MGSALLELSRASESLPYFERAAAQEPGSEEIKLQEATAYAMLGDLGRAETMFKQALEKNPEQIDACIRLAKAYDLEKSGQASGQWQTCRRIYFSNPEKFRDWAAQIPNGPPGNPQ